MHEQEPSSTKDAAPTVGASVPSSKPVKTTIAGTLALLLVGLILFLPTNFVVRTPGPVLNTLGEYNDKELITISGEKSYQSDSILDMTTVYVQGGGQNRVSTPVILEALFNPNKDIVPEETMIPRGVTSEERGQANDSMMVSSQELSIAAAMNELGHEYKTWLEVADFSTDTNKDSLKPGDRLLAFEGKPVTSLEELKTQLDDRGDKTSTMTVQRSSGKDSTKKLDVKVSTAPGAEGTRQLGVFLSTSFDFPIDVEFGVEEVGGPSAGTMFALAIIDRLTEGSLAGDHHIAGTGEITADGEVGAIGGIAQKMVAAKADGATVFLAPADNCSDVAGRVPKGLNVVKIATLHEARQALEQIAQGTDPATLESCS